MIRHEVRFALLGVMLGIVVAAMPSCTKKCDASNCKGCCSVKAECLTGDTVTACGGAASACMACSDGQTCQGGLCATVTMNTDGGNTDGGDGLDAGPSLCATDDDCASRHNGSVCDTRTGDCIPGRGCNAASDCQFNDPVDPCYRFGRQCRCDYRDAPDAGGFTFAGTCRVRKSSCEECTADSECGDDSVIFGPPDGLGFGKCRALTGDSSGKKFCFYQRVGQCPCGTVQDGEGLCRPQSNSCAQVGCRNDKNCPSGSVCTVSLSDDAGVAACGGVCVPRCRWDFGPPAQLVAPGCPPGQTCWVDSQNLNPSSIYYGSGRCKPPCGSDDDCHQSGANPFGGANLKCSAEKLTGGGSDNKRCRANGECMDNAECPALPNNQPYLGYCDRGAFSCQQDCRPGDDPVTGQAYKDCRPPYACAADGGAKFCRLLTCAEQGGATVACSRGQYCCGEDKNSDGIADPCPPKAQQDEAGCYDAPKPPFCTTCMSNDDCKNPQLPSWLTGAGACANGSKSPSCSPLPLRCVYAGNKGMMMGVNICAPSTYNDNTQNASGRRKSQIGCPSGYQVAFIRPDFVGNGESTCASNADCNKGTDAGSCETDMELHLQDGGYGKSCRCTVGTGAAQCPNDLDAGVISECKTGISGQRLYCVDSVVCEPSPGVAYLAPGSPTFGCGL